MMSSHLLRIVLLLCLLTLWWPGTTFGQASALQQRLAKATTLSCAFSIMATGTWKGGTAGAEVTPAKIEVAFSRVDVNDGTADADGRFSGSFVVVRYVNDYLHLMQMHNAGPLYTTTVLARDAGNGRLMAVHTRHEYTDVRLPGFTSRPEMYLGDCAVGS